MLCTIPSCNKTKKGKGYCQGHLRRLNLHGDVFEDVPLRTRTNNKGPCAVPDCAAQAIKRTWCDLHYRRWATIRQPYGQRPEDLVDYARRILKIYADEYPEIGETSNRSKLEGI